MSDLQDIIATSSIAAFNSGVKSGMHEERNRIIEKLERYVADLKECGKKDNCLDIAIAVEGQIQDIKGL